MIFFLFLILTLFLPFLTQFYILVGIIFGCHGLTAFPSHIASFLLICKLTSHIAAFLPSLAVLFLSLLSILIRSTCFHMFCNSSIRIGLVKYSQAPCITLHYTQKCKSLSSYHHCEITKINKSNLERFVWLNSS
ncbi:hypothetical protein AAZX31_14G126100 [Glycine max]